MKIVVNPIKTPDVNAMAQAFYSRSFTSIEDRIQDLDEDALRESLNKYYIGYGHESIGDCGVITVYCEGITMLTAKALEDNPLFSGQETSSRYINFVNEQNTFVGGQSTGDIINDGTAHAKWLDIYKRAFDTLVADFQQKGLDAKTAKLKAFDIARGLLPVTSRTNVAVTMSFRQLAYQLHSIAQYHPIGVVREEGYQILKAIKQHYPDLMAEPKHLRKDWFLHWEDRKALTQVPNVIEPPVYENAVTRDKSKCNVKYAEVWTNINKVPDTLLGTELFCFKLDYGSFRDLQRHRSVHIESTLPLIAHGFHQWYWNALPVSIREEVTQLIGTFNQKDVLNSPLMTSTFVAMQATLPKFIYILNLRTKPTVHPTLRNLMSDLAYVVNINNEAIGITEFDNSGMTQDYDARAKQDITLKEENKVDKFLRK